MSKSNQCRIKINKTIKLTNLNDFDNQIKENRFTHIRLFGKKSLLSQFGYTSY